jgi:hypothetical protein
MRGYATEAEYQPSSKSFVFDLFDMCSSVAMSKACKKQGRAPWCFGSRFVKRTSPRPFEAQAMRRQSIQNHPL